jgi:hypothetical protein
MERQTDAARERGAEREHQAIGFHERRNTPCARIEKAMPLSAVKKTVLSSHLREDLRLKEEPIGELKVFHNDSYSMHVVAYPGIQGHKVQFQVLVVVSMTYKEESLRILLKMREAGEHETAESAIQSVFEKIQAEGKGPYEFVRDAKRWTDIPFTDADLNNLLDVGIDERHKQ